MNAFAKIGTTKFILRMVPDASGHVPNIGPFVVRATSRKAAAAKVRRNWYTGKHELEICAVNRFDLAAYERGY